MRTRNILLVIGIVASCASMAADLNNPGDIADQAFVTQAVSTGFAEIALGKMATARSGNVNIKDLGAMMARDHAGANDELAKLAEAKGIALPDSASSEHDQRESAFESLLPAEFDRRYLDATINDHRQSVLLFQQEIDAGKDPDLRDFAARMLPVIQKHLGQAEALKATPAGR